MNSSSEYSDLELLRVVTDFFPLPFGRGKGWVSFYIAKRYLFSKKSTNVINVISGISVIGLP